LLRRSELPVPNLSPALAFVSELEQEAPPALLFQQIVLAVAAVVTLSLIAM
jgi:hypothetical protein